MISFILFVALAFLFLWLTERPANYLDEIELNYRGKITEKYFLKTYHFVIDCGNKKIDIAGLADELEEEAGVGDSLIKYKDSNCCLLIKYNKQIKLKYINIPDHVLEHSEYLTKISQTECK